MYAKTITNDVDKGKVKTMTKENLKEYQASLLLFFFLSFHNEVTNLDDDVGCTDQPRHVYARSGESDLVPQVTAVALGLVAPQPLGQRKVRYHLSGASKDVLVARVQSVATAPKVTQVGLAERVPGVFDSVHPLEHVESHADQLKDSECRCRHLNR